MENLEHLTLQQLQERLSKTQHELDERRQRERKEFKAKTRAEADRLGYTVTFSEKEAKRRGRPPKNGAKLPGGNGNGS